MTQRTNDSGEQTDERNFVVSRSFEAPRQRMWNALTERDRLLQWFGPKGFKMSVAKMDLRPGGIFHYCLRSHDGHEMWGRFTYREIIAPERLVFVNSFSDEAGNLTRHPFSQTWPLEMLSTITLDEQAGRTTVTVKAAPINPTDAELKTFATGREGMKKGWRGTFDQLAHYIAIT